MNNDISKNKEEDCVAIVEILQDCLIYHEADVTSLIQQSNYKLKLLKFNFTL